VILCGAHGRLTAPSGASGSRPEQRCPGAQRFLVEKKAGIGGGDREEGFSDFFGIYWVSI